jgi:flagellar basal-body rod protein FlgB
VEPITSAIFIKALDGLALRAAATSQNIANANTAAYRPVRVTFEDELTTAASRGTQAVLDTQARVSQSPETLPSGAMRLDLEMATAASTSGRYASIVEVMNRQLQIMALAVAGGR